MRTALAKALDHEMAPLSPVRIMLASVVALGCIALSAAGLQQAWHKTQRMEAAGLRDDSYRAIQSTERFGRVLIRGDRIISWNRGMTALTGWTSKEMVGRQGVRLDVPDAPPNAMTASRLFVVRDYEWKGDGTMRLQRRDGTAVEVRAYVVDFDATREVTFTPAEKP